LEWLTLSQPGTRHGTALLRSFATTGRPAAIAVPGHGPALVSVNDSTGRVLARYPEAGETISVLVPGGGFVVIRR
jgi:hypothetical protein